MWHEFLYLFPRCSIPENKNKTLQIKYEVKINITSYQIKIAAYSGFVDLEAEAKYLPSGDASREYTS